MLVDAWPGEGNRSGAAAPVAPVPIAAAAVLVSSRGVPIDIAEPVPDCLEQLQEKWTPHFPSGIAESEGIETNSRFDEIVN